MDSAMKIKESSNNNEDVYRKCKLNHDNNYEMDTDEEDDEEEGIIKEDVSLTPPSLTPPPLLSPVSDSLSPFSLKKSRSNSNPNPILNQTLSEETSQIPNPKQIEADNYLTYFHSKTGVHRARFFSNYANYKHYYPATSEYRAPTNIIVQSDLGPYSHSTLIPEEVELKLDPELLKAEKKLLELEEKLEYNHLENVKKSENEMLNSKKKLADKSAMKFKKREEDMQFKFMEEVEMKPFDFFAYKDANNQIHFIRKSFVSFTKTKPSIAFSENSKFWKKHSYQKLDEIFKSIPSERVSIIKEFLDNIKKNSQNQKVEKKSLKSSAARNRWWYNPRLTDEKSQNCAENSAENSEKLQSNLICDFSLDDISIPQQSSDNNYISSEQNACEKSKDEETFANREKMVHKVINLLNNNSENGIYDNNDDDFLKEILGEENHKLMLELKKQYDQSMSSNSSLSSAHKSFDESLSAIGTNDDLDGWDIESCSENQMTLKIDTNDLLKLNNESIVLPELDNYTPSRTKSPNSIEDNSFVPVKINPSTPSSTPPPTPEKPKVHETVMSDKKNDSRDKSNDLSKKDKSSNSKSKTSSINKSSKNPYKSKPRSLTPPVDNKRRKRSKSYSRSRSRSHSRSRGSSRNYRWRRYDSNRWRERRRVRSRSRSRSRSPISSSSHRKHRSSSRRSYHSSSSYSHGHNSRSNSKKKQLNSNEKYEKTNNKEENMFYNENKNSYVNGHVYCDQNDSTSYFNNNEYMNYDNSYYDVNFDSYKQNIQTDLVNDNVNNNNLIFPNMVGGPIDTPTSIHPPIPVPPPEPTDPPSRIVNENEINRFGSYGAVALSNSPRRQSLDDRIQNELKKNNFQDVRQISGFGVTTQVVQVGNVLQILPINSSMQVNPLNGNVQNAAMEELMKRHKAERDKRKQERASKRLLNEQIKRDREKQRKLRKKLKVDKLLKKLLSLESINETKIKIEEPTEEKPHTIQSDSLKEPLLNIKKEICDHMITSDDINEKGTKKCVMFADGVKPGEGESPIMSPIELQSPSLLNNKKVLLKEMKRNNLKTKKNHKLKKKIKVKVVHNTENSPANDNLQPPSPPPGSPPSHIWPYPKSFNYKEFLTIFRQTATRPLPPFSLIFPPPIYFDSVQKNNISINEIIQALNKHPYLMPQTPPSIAVPKLPKNTIQTPQLSSSKVRSGTFPVNGPKHFSSSQGKFQTPLPYVSKHNTSQSNTVHNKKDANRYHVTNDLDLISLPPLPPSMPISNLTQ